MVRPKKDRLVSCQPDISYFKPRGIPLVQLEEVRLTVDEREAILLADMYEMHYEEAGERMGVSRATFGRIVQRARKIIADALINGKAIRIEGGNYIVVDLPRIFLCNQCSHQWEAPTGVGRPRACPNCDGADFHRYIEDAPPARPS